MSIAPKTYSCWLCGSTAIALIRSGVDPAKLSPDNFSITDSHYGRTLDVYKCTSCSFKFCPTAGNVFSFYEALVDEEYEKTRAARALQARKLLQRAQHLFPEKNTGKLRLLDIGAGTGILVEQALSLGYEAIGLEPGRWLAAKAQEHKLPVICSWFPCVEVSDPFDVITLVDVIEHVTNPLELLSDLNRSLTVGGIGVIVTPDCNSFIAKVMGKRWWHFRVAHVGYFMRKTLTAAFHKAGLRPIAWIRPAWYFPLDYILIRLHQYLPFMGLKYLARRAAKSAGTFSLPLNLRDSWMVVVERSIAPPTLKK